MLFFQSIRIFVEALLSQSTFVVDPFSKGPYVGGRISYVKRGVGVCLREEEVRWKDKRVVGWERVTSVSRSLSVRPLLGVLLPTLGW